jgi:hypothetical protein
VRPLLAEDTDALEQLDQIRHGFAEAMEKQIQKMWAAKLGLTDYHPKLVQKKGRPMPQPKGPTLKQG